VEANGGKQYLKVSDGVEWRNGTPTSEAHAQPGRPKCIIADASAALVIREGENKGEARLGR